jgi:hypothetical protein
MAETSGSETISPKLQRVAQRQRVRDGVNRLAASPCSEEPYAVVPHVRICGSPGRATASGHPAIGPSEGSLQGAARRLLTCRVAVRFLSEMRHWEAPGEG